MRSSAQRRARNARAFTLIELVVVLLIISTFTALVVPSVAQAMRAKDIDATAAKLCETLQFAYASAVARRQPVTVRLDPDTRRCRVMLRTVALPWLETTPDRPDARTLAAMSWPEEMQLTFSEGTSAAPTRAAFVRRAAFFDRAADDHVPLERPDGGRRDRGGRPREPAPVRRDRRPDRRSARQGTIGGVERAPSAGGGFSSVSQ